MANLSVIIITLNEEGNIADCLESVRWADELIIVDSGSTDRTVEFARKYTDRIFSVPWGGYGATRNHALDQATGEWILWLDADERVTPDLGGEIQAVVRDGSSQISAYSVPRRAFFLGRWIKHCGWYPSRVIRLFRRRSARFSDHRVHERLMVDGPAGELRHDLLHFTDPDLHHYFLKSNRYTSLAAQDLHERGKSFSVLDLLFRPPFMFVKTYFFRLGFLDGMQGFVLCVLSSLYVFTKYAKLWELTRNPRNRKET